MPYIALVESAAAVIPSSGLGNPLGPSNGETLQTLRDELDRLVGGRDDVDPSRLDSWINDAYLDLCSSLDLDDLKGSMTFDLTGAQPLYKLPYEVMATRGAAVIDPTTYGNLGGIPLRKTDLDNYRRRTDVTGEPKEYFRERNLLILWPTPQNVRTISLDFWIRPVRLTQNDHSPILPVEWHEILKMAARMKAFQGLQEFSKAQVAENDFIKLVRRKTDRDEREDEGRIVTSSVPRRRSQLIRKGSFLSNPDLG